jgi:hypothetical protein
MYRLEVFDGGKADHTERLASAPDVLARIPELLKQHAGCEKIVVWMGGTRLFAVDCKGNALQVETTLRLKWASERSPSQTSTARWKGDSSSRFLAGSRARSSSVKVTSTSVGTV